MRARLEHIPALDGVRGAGVAGILLFHAGHLTGGWLGVDLFFVLSGFLITSLLLVEHAATRSISLAAFWARRARRLLPALLALLLGVALYAAVFAAPGELDRIRASGLSTLLYVANWHAIYAEHDYWLLFSAGSPLDHAWSLAIEEQFYLVWPPLCLLVLGVSRGSRRAVAAIALALALCSAAWMAVLHDELTGTARAYYGTDSRAAGVLLGASLAAALRAPGIALARHARVLDLAGLAALVGLAVAWVAVDGRAPFVYRGGLLLFDVLATGVVAAVVVSRQGRVARLFAFRPLRELGLVSYGLYLWHWPVYLVLTPERVGFDGARLTLLRITVSVLIALASYRLLELPIRRGRFRPRTLLRAGVVASSGVALALVGATMDRIGPSAKDVASTPAAVAASGPTILVIGDSAAEQLGILFDDLTKEGPLHVVTQAFPGCSPLVTRRARLRNGLVVDGALCVRARETWIRSVGELAPDLVVLIEGAHGLWDREIGRAWLHACQSRYDARLTDELANLIELLRRAGTRTAIVLMPPVQVRNARAVQASQGDPIEELERIAGRRMTCQNAARRAAVDRAGGVLIDLEAHLCPDGRCAFSELEPLREDGIHFSDPGGRPVAIWLVEQFAEQVSAQPSRQR